MSPLIFLPPPTKEGVGKLVSNPLMFNRKGGLAVVVNGQGRQGVNSEGVLGKVCWGGGGVT